MKETERRASFFQNLVKWREDDIAHASTKLPKQRPSIGEKHPERSPDRLSGGNSWAAIVAVLITKRQIVETVNDRRIERSIRSAVNSQPFQTFIFVDSVKSPRIGEQTEAHDAHHDRE